MKQMMQVSSSDFGYLRQLVYEHAAVVLDADKAYLAELHLEPIATSAGFASIADLVAHLKTQPFNLLHMQAIEALVTNETSFFRDGHPFETLRRFVLPHLVQQRASERSLNIWCAACSTGQEAYSIAILLREHFPQLTNWSLQLVGSDFSCKVLARARQGRYSQLEIQRGLPQPLVQKYFHLQDHEWQIAHEISHMVEFRQINLIQSWSPLPQQDIIFLRNILIYFDTPTKKALLQKIRQQLKRDGYLFLGTGETTLNLDDSFERVQFGTSICYRLRHA